MSVAEVEENVVRPLSPDDLEQVISIDYAHVGESRRRFFEKRLAHARNKPADFVHVGVVRDGVLVGFAIARILRGEFGHKDTTARLDAVGVDRDVRERGVGHALMQGLTRVLRQKGVATLHSQADWRQHAVMRFFDSSGFRLAPRLVLERSVATPMLERIDDA